MRNTAISIAFIFSLTCNAQLAKPKTNVARKIETNQIYKLSGTINTGDWVSETIISKDGKLLASYGLGNFIEIWDLATLKLLRRIINKDTEYIHGISFSNDGKYLAAGGDNGIKIYTVNNGEFYKKISNESIGNVQFSRDGKKLFASTKSNEIKIWSIIDEILLMTLKNTGYGDYSSFALSYNETIIASQGQQNETQIWDLSTGKLIRKYNDNIGSTLCFSFSPDNKKLAVTGGGEIIIYDLNIEKKTHIITNNDGSSASISYNPSGTKILYANCWYTYIKIYDTKTNKLIQTLRGHKDRVESARFNYNGTKIISSSSDESIKIWNLQ